jgi:hypothetical protein
MSTRRIESFLLRLVLDDQDGANTEAWRGRIQHIGSGHERQFERLQDIIVFINELFGASRMRWLRDDEPASEA